MLGVVAQILRDRGRWISEFEANLVNIEKSVLARAARETVSHKYINK